MIRLKIFHKLGLSHFFLGTLTLIIVSFTFYKALETALIERTTSQVNSINVLKKTQIINHLQQKKRNFKIFKKNILIANSIKLILSDKHNLANTAFVYSKQWSELIKDFDYKNVVILDTTFKIIYSSNSLWDSTTFSIEEKYFKKFIIYSIVTFIILALIYLNINLTILIDNTKSLLTIILGLSGLWSFGSFFINFLKLTGKIK